MIIIGFCTPQRLFMNIKRLTKKFRKSYQNELLHAPSISCVEPIVLHHVSLLGSPTLFVVTESLICAYYSLEIIR